MPPHPPRRARFALPVVLGLALVAAPLDSARSAEASGDPDIPSAIQLESSPAQPSFLRSDLDHLASSGTLRVLAAGSLLTLAVHGDENADRAESALDRPAFDGGLDFGNTYGHGALLGAGALGLFAAGALADDPNLRGA